MSSLQQVPRLLALVPYLVRHPGARVADVAVDFGVSPEQVRRDLHVLWYCGVSGMPDDLIDINMDQVDQHGVIHLSNADFLSRPLVLSPTEALTLVVGLQALRQVAGPDAVGAIDQALAKVRAALGTRSELPDQVVVEVRSAADRVRATLDEAIARQRRIEMEYQPDHVLESQRRNVDPHSARATTVHLDTRLWGVEPGDPFDVEDLVTGQSWTWTDHNYVHLDAFVEPVHILRVKEAS